MNQKLKDLLSKWDASGRVSHYYPRQKRVALNGGKSKTEAEAMAYLVEFFADQAKLTKVTL